MDNERLNELAMAVAKKLGVDDAVVLSVNGSEKIVRFANNSVTLVNQTEETELMVYLARDKRRIIAGTSDPEEANVKRFVTDLHTSLKGVPRADYSPLPDERRSYRSATRVDRKIANVEEQLPELAGEAIQAARKGGAQRAAGIISASRVSVSILTSSGTRGTDSHSGITLNIRAFAEKEASGHGLSCSATMAGFDPIEAGRRAGEDAKNMVDAGQPEPGAYEVLFSPTVASNLVGTVVDASSAFSVEAGTSYLTDKLGKKVASDSLTIFDHGIAKGGLGGRSFDDEGTATRTTPIIQKGLLKNYLHNLTTARRWKTSTTGNAGLVTPHPWNIEVGAGSASFEEMRKHMKHGIVLTSNWYTRFKNYRTGEFSTVPRDGAYLIEKGKVVKSLKGMRVSDELDRLFSSVKMLSKKREWIQWWEVDTPTLCPWMLMDGVKITRAYE